MLRKASQFLCGAALALSWGSAAFALDVAPPAGFVNDRAGFLAPAYAEDLEAQLRAYAEKTGNEIAVLTLPSLGGEPIEFVSEQVFREWGIGKQGKDNGLLLLLSLDDRQARIEVGYGLEPYITDGRAGEIIRSLIAPAFQAGNYGEGVANAIYRIMSFLESAPVEPGGSSSSSGGATGESLVNLFFFALFFFLRVGIGFMVALASTPSIWLGGFLGALFGGALGYFFDPTGFFAVIPAAFVFGLFGLLLDFLLSRHYSHIKASGKPDPWWFHGGHFGGGGGGFGGFGGGRSGGGGASGGW